MSLYTTENARPLGNGLHSAAGSITDPDVASMVMTYKRLIASNYRAITSDEIGTLSKFGHLKVQPKIDGELWFLVMDEGEAFFANPKGRVISGDIPFVKEAEEMAKKLKARKVIAGELFAAGKQGEGRPRSSDVSKAMGGEASAAVERLGFMAFDLVMGGEAEHVEYIDRHKEIEEILESGKRVRPVKTHGADSTDEAAALYKEIVVDGNGEGLVIRTGVGPIFKVKPELFIDAAIIGYTERGDAQNQVRSVSLALMREDGNFQVLASCGNFTEKQRVEMLSMLADLEVPSNQFRQASSEGALYRLVRPQFVIEVKATDVLSENANGDPIQKMVILFDEEKGWRGVRKMPGASLISPVFVRVREDKEVNATDIRVAQLLERCVVPEVQTETRAI
ncbi:MAG: hypothetical protein QF473_12040, partial [Planctomycetota bacterium]|nr:hypothetical protein [Planctomycetota bacterium]